MLFLYYLPMCFYLLLYRQLLRPLPFPLGSLVMLIKVKFFLLMHRCVPWDLADPRHQRNYEEIFLHLLQIYSEKNPTAFHKFGSRTAEVSNSMDRSSVLIIVSSIAQLCVILVASNWQKDVYFSFSGQLNTAICSGQQIQNWKMAIRKVIEYHVKCLAQNVSSAQSLGRLLASLLLN